MIDFWCQANSGMESQIWPWTALLQVFPAYPTTGSCTVWDSDCAHIQAVQSETITAPFSELYLKRSFSSACLLRDLLGFPTILPYENLSSIYFMFCLPNRYVFIEWKIWSKEFTFTSSIYAVHLLTFPNQFSILECCGRYVKLQAVSSLKHSNKPFDVDQFDTEQNTKLLEFQDIKWCIIQIFIIQVHKIVSKFS